MRLLIASLFLSLASGAQASASFTAATPYLQAGDNPLSGPYAWRYLETFEDGQLNTTGLSASAGTVNLPGQATDSVDGDDGAIDGLGQAGRSWYSGQTVNLIRFSFSAPALGSLPTQVGLAFTDVGQRNDGGASGFDTASIEVFDAGGTSQGVLSFAFGDGSVLGGTAEDRFVGASFAGGIGSVVVGFAHSVDWEVDHIFYASDVPEPAPAVLLAAGLLALTLRRLRAH